MNQQSKIFIAGHRGMVGSAISREFSKKGYTNLLTKTRSELDLLDQKEVHEFFQRESIEGVVLCAAKVGGILANNNAQADFLYENLVIATNVIHAAAEYGVNKLVFLGSACIYPKLVPQPMREDALLTGKLEPTNEGYAIAKIAGLKLCEKYKLQYGKDFVSVMPNNLYGPFDNFDLQSSHVIPALIRKFHEAKKEKKKEVVIWGSGTPLREFLHVDDLAEAVRMVFEDYSELETINVASGEEVSIRELAEEVQKVVGFEGVLTFDSSKPDGTPRKLLEISKINAMGWKPSYTLKSGLEQTYQWALETGELR
ncbi:MAG: GDP-fucose synthetase [Bdellovibrionaceae bacterium]|nr:GDP-fucose synthetase [Pseudobdellovibrionaceae bacterium]|tara:strand:+ start:378 stop:1313 length:936 start_codon:yes stop_codon:yes gene_type:complete